MTSIEGMPHTGSDAYIAAVLDLARGLGYPRVELPDDAVVAGEASKGA